MAKDIYEILTSNGVSGEEAQSELDVFEVNNATPEEQRGHIIAKYGIDIDDYQTY